MPTTCSKCSKAISPTVMDLVPSYLWSVEIHCPSCEHSNRLPWLASFMLVGLATALAFATAIPLLSTTKIPTGFAAVLIVAAWLILVRAMLLLYLRFSSQPFASSRGRA